MEMNIDHVHWKREYEKYLETMKVYQFVPSGYVVWLSWKLMVSIPDLEKTLGIRPGFSDSVAPDEVGAV